MRGRRRRRRAHSGGIRLRKRYARDMSRPGRMLNFFLQDFEDGEVDPYYFVFVENGRGRVRCRYEKKRRHGYSNVKVSDDTMRLLRSGKEAMREMLGSYAVYSAGRERDPREKGAWRRLVWALERRWFYACKDFVENTYVVEKHLGSSLSLGSPEIVEKTGKPVRTTSVSRKLKERLLALKEEHGYETLDRLMYAILTRGEYDFEGFLGELNEYVDRELQRWFGLGKRGNRVYVTRSAESFLSDWYNGIFRDPSRP